MHRGRAALRFAFRHLLVGGCIIAAGATWAQGRQPPALGEHVCGRISNHFGPFDYRTVLDKNRLAVELWHFTAPVAALQRGETSNNIGSDLEYTLKVMPNHHPALSTLVRLARRDKTNKPAGMGWSVECFFDRALRIAPDDARTWAVYADYLIQLRRTDEALWAMNHAAQLSPDEGLLAYNLGLVALDLKDSERAMQFARKAYSSGIDLPGLRSRLQSEGKWRDGP